MAFLLEKQPFDLEEPLVQSKSSLKNRFVKHPPRENTLSFLLQNR